jgi:hypothetical protein
MDDPHVVSSLVTTGGLFALAVFSKILCEPANSQELGRELLDQALQWRHYADEDTAPLMKLQHALYSNAYLHAARTTIRDSELERIAGIDIRKLKRGTDQKVKESLQSITQKCPKFKGQVVQM